MITVLLTALAVAAVARGQDCHLVRCNAGIAKYYSELGCVPVTGPGGCCPARFDCDAALARRANDKCHLRGQVYDKHAILTSEQLGEKCIAECRCVENGQLADFRCVSIECFDQMGVPPPLGCVYQYSPNECCSTGVDCSNNTQVEEENFTCTYNRRIYTPGQEINQRENPCMSCKCQKGFNGTLREPWCFEFNCGIEIHYGGRIREGCVPVLLDKIGCCPIGWRCPEESDSVIAADRRVPTAERTECLFGSLRLKIGDKLNTLDSEKCVECECSVPPHVSCIKTKC